MAPGWRRTLVGSATASLGRSRWEIVEQVRARDEADDEELGEARGDELPEELRTPERVAASSSAVPAGSSRANKPAAWELDVEPSSERQAETEREYEFDAERIVARVQGREGWRREAHRQLERQRWEDPDPIPSSREQRLLLAIERLEDDLGAVRAGNEAYEAWRAAGVAADGSRRMAPGTTNPYQPPEVPAGHGRAKPWPHG